MSTHQNGELSTSAKPGDKAAGGTHPAIPVSIGAMLVTLGVVYGDIGTSPMYVTKALVAGNGGIMSVTQEFVLGALSLVIWTVTLLTTVKYVLISLKADNHGEGGIFALYSIVRRFGKWLIIPAMLGGSALLADGILTPAVTVTTAIEGLRTIPEVYGVIGDNQMNVVAITLAIICLLFVVQRAGTSKIGRAFGPVMTLWFVFLGVMGLLHVLDNPVVFLAINPVYGIQFLLSPNNHAGFMILGSCFLATTGAEALYSDMATWAAATSTPPGRLLSSACSSRTLARARGCYPTPAMPRLLAVDDLNPFFQMLDPGIRPFCGAALYRRGDHRLAGAHHRRVQPGLGGHPPRPHAPHADVLPGRDQGPALYPHGQLRAVDWLRRGWCCSSRAQRTWRRRTAWPSPSLCSAQRFCSSSICIRFAACAWRPGSL